VGPAPVLSLQFFPVSARHLCSIEDLHPLRLASPTEAQRLSPLLTSPVAISVLWLVLLSLVLACRADLFSLRNCVSPTSLSSTSAPASQIPQRVRGVS
jgi:hypothetical protein